MNAATLESSQWQDITQDFMNSIQELKLGELLKLDHFTLFEAMTALELMDPKMDSGMMMKKIDRKILTLEQSLKQGIIKKNNLELIELIGIIDDTYSCLVTWLEGHSLAQTVMTNLYLHDPERIEDRCLRVFCQAMLKTVDYIDGLVQTVYCIEEEDFFLNVGKFSLASHTNDQKILSSLEDLCVHYEKLLQAQTKSQQTVNQQQVNKKQQQESQQQQQSIEPSIQPETCYDKVQLTALINRLRFTYNFYAFFRNVAKNLFDLGLLHNEAHLMKTIKLIQTTASNCDKNLEKCLTFTDNWIDTIDIGIKPKQANNKNPVEGDYPTIMGFEPLINHKLMPPCFPRCASIKSRPLTVDYLKNLIIRFRQCISASNSFTNLKNFIKSLDMIEHLSKYSKPESCVLSRSFMQLLYEPNRFSKILKDELLSSMNEFCEPLVQAMKKDDSKLNALNDFLTESSKTFLQAIFIYGHNAAKQHEKFPDLILSFKNLQYSGFLINTAFNNCLIYSWTTCHLAKFCIKYVLAGLELELFSTYEYPYVFWYLYDILYRNEREQLEIAKNAIFESQINNEFNNNDSQQLNQTSNNNTNSGGASNNNSSSTNTKNKTTNNNINNNNKINKKQRRKNQKQYNTNFHDKSLLCNDAFRFLSGGIFLLTYGLKLQGKIKNPPMNYTNEEICFEQRFGTLTAASVYKSYRNTLSRLEKLEYIYREALECFTEAKEIFTALGEQEACLKVCKTNMVVAKILSTNQNSFLHRDVEFSFDTHPSFPTAKF